MMMEVTKVGSSGYRVKFPYKPWLVAGIKKIPGASFRSTHEGKWWFVPGESEPALMRWVDELGGFEPKEAVPVVKEPEPLPDLDIDIDNIIYHRGKKAAGEPCTMYPYQKLGVAYGLMRQRYMIGDDMGLGKTVQAIATLTVGQAKCILIVCPVSLKENWRREWRQWADKDAIILSDRTKRTWPQYYKVGICNVFIVSYQSLRKYFVDRVDEFIDEETGKKKPLRLNHIHFKDTVSMFDAVVFDESHRCKDGKRQVTKFAMGIAKGKKWVLALTGTPVVNKPKDLVPQLHILGRLVSDFGGYKYFIERYCQGYNEASNLKELNYKLTSTCFYRRLKKEVLHDLPDKTRSIVLVDITTRKEYEKAELDLVNYLRENMHKTDGEITRALRGQAMVLMGILKKIAAVGKVDAMVETISDLVESGEKTVVFAWHEEIVNTLKNKISGAVTIVGKDSEEVRQQNVDAFQEDPKCMVIICNIKSGGVGITLTASSNVNFIELPWHPADADQCEDRCWRIGVKKDKNVQAKYLLGINTIDEYLYDIIENKRDIAKQVTGSENEIKTDVEADMKSDDSTVDELIKTYTKKYNII